MVSIRCTSFSRAFSSPEQIMVSSAYRSADKLIVLTSFWSDGCRRAMNNKGIEIGVHYTPNHFLSFFKSADVIFFLLPASAANFFCFGEYLLNGMLTP